MGRVKKTVHALHPLLQDRRLMWVRRRKLVGEVAWEHQMMNLIYCWIKALCLVRIKLMILSLVCLQITGTHSVSSLIIINPGERETAGGRSFILFKIHHEWEKNDKKVHWVWVWSSSYWWAWFRQQCGIILPGLYTQFQVRRKRSCVFYFYFYFYFNV